MANLSIEQLEKQVGTNILPGDVVTDFTGVKRDIMAVNPDGVVVQALDGKAWELSRQSEVFTEVTLHYEQ